MTKTLKLTNEWDLTVDERGNIATIEGNERLAQDVASSVLVWYGECPMDTTRGVEYNRMDEIKDTLNNDMNNQALLVEGVSDSFVVFEKVENRVLQPVIYVTNEENETITVGA